MMRDLIEQANSFAGRSLTPAEHDVWKKIKSALEAKEATIERLESEVKAYKDTQLQVCKHLFISGSPEGMNRIYCPSCDNEYMVPSKAFALQGDDDAG